MKKGKARWKRICVMGTIGILAFILTGCGAIFKGTSTEVSLSSQPTGVEVEIQPNGQKVMTPGTIKLKNNETYTLTARKDSYKQQTQTISKKIRTVDMVLDILFWLPEGILIDYFTGGLYDLDKNSVHFWMEPEKQSSQPRS